MAERIKLMQRRLELKLEEGRNVNQELSLAKEEKLRLEQENTRLRHRSDITRKESFKTFHIFYNFS